MKLLFSLLCCIKKYALISVVRYRTFILASEREIVVEQAAHAKFYNPKVIIFYYLKITLFL
jgi:hypothetical protein